MSNIFKVIDLIFIMEPFLQLYDANDKTHQFKNACWT